MCLLCRAGRKAQNLDISETLYRQDQLSAEFSRAGACNSRRYDVFPPFEWKARPLV